MDYIPNVNPKRQIKGAQNKAIGKILENYILAACSYYESKGVAKIEKTPEPMKVIRRLDGGKFVACFEKAAQPDFKGELYGGRAVVFEAKYSGTSKIQQSRVTPEQWRSMEGHSRLGAECFILVSFAFQSFYRIEWAKWRDMEKIYGRKYLKESDISEMKLKFESGIIKFL